MENRKTRQLEEKKLKLEILNIILQITLKIVSIVSIIISVIKYIF